MLRGIYGGTYGTASGTPLPDPAVPPLFADTNMPAWGQAWAEQMYRAGLTAGCQSAGQPLMFCPLNNLTRVEASVFALRLKYGVTYGTSSGTALPPATGTLLADMTDPTYWGTAWAEKAYLDGLLPACGAQGGQPMFCPTTLVDRAWAAYMIVIAKGLPLP